MTGVYEVSQSAVMAPTDSKAPGMIRNPFSHFKRLKDSRLNSKMPSFSLPHVRRHLLRCSIRSRQPETDVRAGAPASAWQGADACKGTPCRKDHQQGADSPRLESGCDPMGSGTVATTPAAMGEDAPTLWALGPTDDAVKLKISLFDWN